MRRIDEEIDKFKKDKIFLLIHSHLFHPPKPKHKIYYRGLNTVQEVVSDFISRGFNQSLTVDVTAEFAVPLLLILNPNTWVMEMGLKAFVQNNVGSNILFLPVADVRRAAFTCAGLSTRISFTDYVRPYDTAAWLGIVGTCVLSSFLFCIVPRYRQLKHRVPFLLASILFEMSYDVTGSKYKLRTFRWIFGPLILMGVVLSNGYKGVVITSVVKPFEVYGVESLEAAINLGYTYIAGHYEEHRYDCCKSSPNLTTKIKSLMTRDSKEDPMIETGIIETCGDYVTYDERFDLLTHIPLPHDALLALNNAGSFENLSANGKLDKKGTALTKLAKATRPLPCGGELYKELATGPDKFYLDALERLKILSAIEKFNPDRIASSKFYIVEDKTNLLPATQWGIHVSPLNMARKALTRDAPIFVESGLNDKIQELSQWYDWINVTNIYRRNYGRLEDQSTIPRALDLDTKIRVLFYIYTLFILLTILLILFELVVNYFTVRPTRVETMQLKFFKIKMCF